MEWCGVGVGEEEPTKTLTDEYFYYNILFYFADMRHHNCRLQPSTYDARPTGLDPAGLGIFLYCLLIIIGAEVSYYFACFFVGLFAWN